MRRPGLLLLICLLTLRLWVGEAMAFASLPTAAPPASAGATAQSLPACHEPHAQPTGTLADSTQDAQSREHSSACEAWRWLAGEQRCRWASAARKALTSGVPSSCGAQLRPGNCGWACCQRKKARAQRRWLVSVRSL